MHGQRKFVEEFFFQDFVQNRRIIVVYNHYIIVVHTESMFNCRKIVKIAEKLSKLLQNRFIMVVKSLYMQNRRKSAQD